MKNVLMCLALIFVIGCASAPRPMQVGGFDGTDVIKIPSGSKIHIPAGSKIDYLANGKIVNTVAFPKDVDIVTVKSGRFLSDEVLTDIIDNK